MCYDVILLFVSVFFFKQKTAYEMRISDWSSDVCSPDLLRVATEPVPRAGRGRRPQRAAEWRPPHRPCMECERDAGCDLCGRSHPRWLWQIGRASCRERVCQYV